MIDYQRALARALSQGKGDVPGVSPAAVAGFARQAERKLVALRGSPRRSWFERWLHGVQSPT